MHAHSSLLTPFFSEVARLCDIKALQAASIRLRDKYVTSPVPPLQGQAEHVAYALCRMPATFAAVMQALTHLKHVIPAFSPASVLDVGSGPGTAAFGAMLSFPTIQAGLGLERSDEFCRLAQTLFLTVRPQASFQTKKMELEREPSSLDSFDLLTGAYVMGELSQGAQDRWLSFAKEHAKVVLLVEPGTPAGWSCLMRCRDTLLSRGAELLAPCPHAKQCPFVGTDGWCHEAVRLPRTSLHRRLKEGQLGYEDEKFCYLAATFDPDLRRTVPPGRIVHAPRHRHGHTHLVLCTRNGVLEPTIISRKYRELYRLVREAGWGDSVPLLKEDLT